MFELKGLFESDTIKPTFDYVHVILTLLLFRDHPEGLGRYRLMKELLIGSGTARSLITKLNKKTNFLTVTTENKRKGHTLTENGIKFLKQLSEKIPVVEEGDNAVLKEIIIETKNVKSYYCQIKNGANKLKNGIEQRDAAIKIGGLGTTCLIYDGSVLKFPVKSMGGLDDNKMNVNDNIQQFFIARANEKNVFLEKNDVITIGLGDCIEKARLAALNAALTLL